jgi:hypothetical protein
MTLTEAIEWLDMVAADPNRASPHTAEAIRVVLASLPPAARLRAYGVEYRQEKEAED